MKVCKQCGVKKPYIEFSKRKVSKDGLQPKCKMCAKKYAKKYGKENPETHKRWLDNNRKRAYEITTKWRFKHRGVYGIFENGKCLYVGESSQVNQRFSNHKSHLKNPMSAPGVHKDLYKKLQTHNHLIFGVIEECENHKEREQHFIDMYNPMYNNV